VETVYSIDSVIFFLELVISHGIFKEIESEIPPQKKKNRLVNSILEVGLVGVE
jgi:hypothetical protein